LDLGFFDASEPLQANPTSYIINPTSIKERLQTKLRPGLETVQVGQEVCDRLESGVEEIGLSWADGRRFDVEEMHDAQMNLADRRFVVVNQSYALLGVRGIDDDFFVQLAAHAFFVGNGVVRYAVFDGDVSPDADAALAVQPAFAHPFATGVLE